jgi:Predicted P-loop ATPase and inactivated derivatives
MKGIKELDDNGGWYGKEKRKRATFDQIVQLIEDERTLKLQLNTMRNRPELNGKPLKDTDYSGIRVDLMRSFNLHIDHSEIVRAIDKVVSQNPYDPLVEYLGGLKWDGVNRLEHVLSDTLGCERSEYTKEISKRFFVSAADRALNPGCRHRLFLILSGPEDVGKSLFCYDLCANSEWYTDYLPRDLNSIRSMEAISGKWIVESAELVSMRQSEQEAIKAFISRPSDYYRGAYKHVPEDIVRRCVLIGTTNSETPIPNDAEWTRFWPAKVTHRYERDWLLENRDNLWAEAVACLYDGYRWWSIDDSLRTIISKERQNYREEDSWEEAIRNIASRETSTKQVSELIGIPLERVTRSVEMRIANLLRKHGWKVTSVWRDGKVIRRWVR